MKKQLLLLSLSLLSGFSFMACEKDDPSTITYDCTNLTPTYTNAIKAIMDNNCLGSGCHNSNNRAAGIDLSTYSAVSGEADKARFRGSIEHLAGYSNMPRNRSKLSEEDLQKIYCWIESGKPQ